MRDRAIAVAVASLVLVAGLVGCGGSGDTTTGTLPTGVTVQPEQYLADTRQIAEAITDFAAIVNALPAPLTAQALRSAAVGMAEPLDRARRAQARITAMRLEDQRLESQRGRAQTANAVVIVEMERMRSTAAARDLAGAKRAAAGLQTAIAGLRNVGEPTG